MEKGYDLLLEKPISPSLEECRQIQETAERLGRKVVVCHVLRYTPFYQFLYQTVRSGEIGQVVAIQAIENVGYWHQAHSFVRGNWRNSQESSPMILQKSCHDMDILRWLSGQPCKRISSFGSLTYFRPENAPRGSAAVSYTHLDVYKRQSNDRTSTIVEIKGLAMTAGSRPIFLAPIGSSAPTILERMTVTTNVRQTAAAIREETRSNSNSLT